MIADLTRAGVEKIVVDGSGNIDPNREAKWSEYSRFEQTFHEHQGSATALDTKSRPHRSVIDASRRLILP
jgi:hypothetical protein